MYRCITINSADGQKNKTKQWSGTTVYKTHAILRQFLYYLNALEHGLGLALI